MKSFSSIYLTILLAGLMACKTAENSTDASVQNNTTDIDRTMETKSSIENHEGMDASVPFIEIASGLNSKFDKETAKIITNETEFEKVWKIANGNLMNPDPMPEVDFENKILIVVAAGEKNSGGYYIQVESIADVRTHLMVNIEETAPGKGCAVTEAITYPYQIIELDKPNKTIRFNTTEKIVDCK
ncbi:MAG: hypothetical protein Kow0079_16190 [Vicingaceae bacterium]